MGTSNPPRNTTIAWLFVSLAALGLTIIFFNLDVGGWGYALMFLSFVLFITGVIASAIYGSRSRKLLKLLSPKGHLVHWTYSLDEWKQFAEKEFATQKSFNKKLFFMVAGFALLCGIVVLIIDFEPGLWVMLAMLLLIGVTGFAAWFSGWNNYRLNMSNPGEAYLSGEGVYIAKQLHLWNAQGAFLKSAEYVKGVPSLLEFTYQAPARYGLQEYSVRVPVPRGKEDKARDIVSQFSSVLGAK